MFCTGKRKNRLVKPPPHCWTVGNVLGPDLLAPSDRGQHICPWFPDAISLLSHHHGSSISTSYIVPLYHWHLLGHHGVQDSGCFLFTCSLRWFHLPSRYDSLQTLCVPNACCLKPNPGPELFPAFLWDISTGMSKNFTYCKLSSWPYLLPSKKQSDKINNRTLYLQSLPFGTQYLCFSSRLSQKLGVHY